MADRASAPPSQPQQREMVYCHQCENEWYRDEHGLTCPECQSNFVEIIEPDHDPRADNLPDLEPPPGLLGGRPGHHGPHGAPDPDEEDIDNLSGGDGMQWERTGPGQMRGTFNQTYHFGDGGQHQGHGQPGGGMGGGLFGVLSSVLGGAFNAAGQQGQPGQGQQPEQGDDLRPMSPNRDQGSRAQSAPGQARQGPNVRHYQTPLGHFTIATSSSANFGGGGLFPRNANEPQPPQQQPEGVDDLLRMMFNIGAMPPGMAGGGGGMMGGPPQALRPLPGMGFGGGHAHPFMGGPFGGLFQMLGGMPMGGVHGDAVFSQEDLDRVITQLMEQHQSGNAPGPATEAAIAALPRRKIEKKDLDDQGKADCSICMEEVHIDEEVTVLPCSHWFHGECIKAWLGEHDTCPHCRQGIMPKEGGQDSSRPRDPNQAPLHDMMNNPPPPPGANDVPVGFPGSRDQTPFGQDQGYGNQSMPGMQRRSSSTGPSDRRSSGQRLGSSGGGQGGMFQRMRDAFGNSSRRSGNDGSAGAGQGRDGNAGI